MSVERDHSRARRRETQLPASFVTIDRRPGRSSQRQRMGQLPEESSLIVLSSAENTLMTSMDGGRRSGRRSTRLTDIDMTLDETGIGAQSLDSSELLATDGTNTSVINVDQTTMIERERAKSSVFPRWTGSLSCAPAGPDETAEGIRRSSIFSMVTKRNRRRPRSIVRSSIQEDVTRNRSTTGQRVDDPGQDMDLSKISEEQVESSSVGEKVPATPKGFVPELVIQTRSMLKKGKKWKPSQNGIKSPNREKLTKTSTVKEAVDQTKRQRKRKQKTPISTAVTEDLGSETQSNKSTPLVSLITRRKRRNLNREPQVLDANQNLSSASKGEVPSEVNKSIASSGTECFSSSDQSKSNVGNDSQFSNVSKRKRPKPMPDKEAKSPEESTPGEAANQVAASESDSVIKRTRINSAIEAGGQLAQELNKSMENNSQVQTRSASRSRRVAPGKTNIMEGLDCTAKPRGRGRARKKALSESVQIGSVEPAVVRARIEISESKPVSTGKSEKTPNVSQNRSTKLKDVIQPEPDESITASELKSSSEQSISSPGVSSPFSNVSKRKRPKPVPVSDPESLEQSATAPEPEPKLTEPESESKSKSKGNRSRIPRAVSRQRHAEPDENDDTAKEAEKSFQPRGRGRARQRAISESARTTPTESIAIRAGRSKSALRNDATKPKPPGVAKSGKISTRSKSVPRGVLSPPPGNNPNHSTADHVPVYRRYAEKVLQLNRSALPRPDPIATFSSGDDVYKFDSPSQSSAASSSDDGKRKPKGSTAKKRPRLATSMSSRSRKTPVKHHHTTVFGTDMGKICSVVKKIGGGPVRRRADDGATAANQNVVHTSTLVAIVQPLQPSNVQNIVPRSPSPAVFIHEMADDDHHHHQDHEDNEENIPSVELPTPLSPPRLNPNMERVLQQQPAPTLHTPNKPAVHSSTLNFSPQASSSPWRVQNENILPKTFYFSRSKDLLPSYESDLVVRDENPQPAVTPQDIPPAAMEPVHPRRTSPNRQHSFVRPAAVPPTAVSSAVFKDIQRSYEQLKATSDMSEKLISAMRKYKSNVHNETSASLADESSAEALIAKFRMYEENMKKTYQKLEQWYKRSQRTLAESMKAIKQTSSVPKTAAQQAVVDNFRRDSQRFVTMINDLESAMNDSNIENISPPKTTENSGRPPFKDIIVSERNRSDPNRSPLKTLDITNVPPRFSPVKSPLVKASFTSFSGNRTTLHSRSRDRFSKLSLVKPSAAPNETESSTTLPTAAEKSVIEIADTVMDGHATLDETNAQQMEKDLFGFETDDEQEEEAATETQPVEPTPVKITRETLKERLQSVRKLLPAPSRIGSASKSATIQTRSNQAAQRIFNSPRRKRVPQSIMSASTPLAQKRNQPNQRGEQDPNLSAIPVPADPTTEVDQTGESGAAPRTQESPPAAVFDEPEQELASTSLASSANRTYSRVPRRNARHKPNIYLAKLGISDDEDGEQAEPDSDDWTEPGKGKRRKKVDKARAPKQKRKKKTVEQSAEFQNFVTEFNSMCDQVNRYQLVIEKPSVPQPV